MGIPQWIGHQRECFLALGIHFAALAPACVVVVVAVAIAFMVVTAAVVAVEVSFLGSVAVAAVVALETVVGAVAVVGGGAPDIQEEPQFLLYGKGLLPEYPGPYISSLWL